MRKIMIVLALAFVACNKAENVDIVDTWKVTRYSVDSCPKYAIYSGKHVRRLTNVTILADKPESEIKAYIAACKKDYYIDNYNYGGDTVNYHCSYATYQHN